MSMTQRIKKLEGERGIGGTAEYVVDSWDDYDRVRREIGWPKVPLNMSEFEEERQPDPYQTLLSEGRLVETPRFKQDRRDPSAFIQTHLGSGELPEF